MARMTVWDPVRDFVSLRDAMDRLIEDSVVRTAGRPAERRVGGFCRPAADGWEDGDAIFVQMDLPGVNPDEVDVMYEQDALVISGEFVDRAVGSDEEREWLMRERPCGQFQRRFALNVPLDLDAVSATYNDGVLTLRLPKSEATKPRKIEVKAG